MITVVRGLLLRYTNAAVMLTSLIMSGGASWAQSPDWRSIPSWDEAGSIPLSVFYNTVSSTPLSAPPSVAPTAADVWSRDTWNGQQFSPTPQYPFADESVLGYRFRSMNDRNQNNTVVLPQQTEPVFDPDSVATRWDSKVLATPYRFRHDTRLAPTASSQPIPGYRFRPQ